MHAAQSINLSIFNRIPRLFRFQTPVNHGQAYHTRGFTAITNEARKFYNIFHERSLLFYRGTVLLFPECHVIRKFLGWSPPYNRLGPG